MLLMCLSLTGCAVPEGTPNTLPYPGTQIWPWQFPEPDWTTTQPGNSYPDGTFYPYIIVPNGEIDE